MGTSPTAPVFPTDPAPGTTAIAPAPRTRTPRGPSSRKTEATRLSIIDAAFAEFLEHGYARGTTASVARRAHLSKVTLFRYFSSKEALFDAVIQRHIASAALAIQSSNLRDDESVAQFLLRTLAPAMDLLDSSGRAATARLVIAEGLEFPLLAQMYLRHAHLPLVERIRGLAVIAQQRGELKEPGLLEHPELLLGPLWIAMMNNTVLQPQSLLNAGALFRLQVCMLFQVKRARTKTSATKKKPAPSPAIFDLAPE